MSFPVTVLLFPATTVQEWFVWMTCLQKKLVFIFLLNVKNLISVYSLNDGINLFMTVLSFLFLLQDIKRQKEENKQNLHNCPKLLKGYWGMQLVWKYEESAVKEQTVVLPQKWIEFCTRRWSGSLKRNMLLCGCLCPRRECWSFLSPRWKHYEVVLGEDS